jgi:cobalt-zinc-cadmium efflux system outer membrane protein
MTVRPSKLQFQRAALAALLCFQLAPTVAAPTVAEAVQAALERSPNYPLHQATRAVGEGYREQGDAFLGGDPSLGLVAKSDKPIGSDNGYREYEAALALPLWWPGQRGARRAIGDRLDQQATTELRLLAWEVAGEVLARAWELRLALGAEQQAEHQWQAAVELERNVTRRVEAGELPRADRLLAQQETLARQTALDQAKAQVRQARAAWRSRTGLTELPEDLERPPEEAPGEPATPHPRLTAAMDRVATAQARSNDRRLNRRPRPVLTLFAKRDRGSSEDPYTNSVGAGIEIPFGSGAHAAPGLAEAEAELTRAQARLAEIERDLRLTREQAARGVEQAERGLDLATRSDALARSRLALSRRAFDLGESDLYLLLRAREQAADAALALERSRLQRARAIALYRHALGDLPQ